MLLFRGQLVLLFQEGFDALISPADGLSYFVAGNVLFGYKNSGSLALMPFNQCRLGIVQCFQRPDDLAGESPRQKGQRKDQPDSQRQQRSFKPLQRDERLGEIDFRQHDPAGF